MDTIAVESRSANTGGPPLFEIVRDGVGIVFVMHAFGEELGHVLTLDEASALRDALTRALDTNVPT